MAIYKNKDIDVSINVDSIDKGNIKANFYTEDKSTSAINIYVNWDKHPLNLNNVNMQLQLDLFHSDGSIFMDEPLNIIYAENGLVQYKISDNVIKHVGKVNAKLFLKNDQESIHVANFSFNIKDSGIEGAISKEININLVEDTVKKIMNESPELFKGEKGDKLSFSDLTDEEKEELKGEPGKQGEQGEKGDTVVVPPKIYTREEYDQLETKDSNTLYFISEV